MLFGAWVRFKLHRYLSLDPAGPDSTGAPLVSNRLASSVVPALLTAIGALVLALATAACNCAVKGSAPKLYIVSISTGCRTRTVAQLKQLASKTTFKRVGHKNEGV